MKQIEIFRCDICGAEGPRDRIEACEATHRVPDRWPMAVQWNPASTGLPFGLQLTNPMVRITGISGAPPSYPHRLFIVDEVRKTVLSYVHEGTDWDRDRADRVARMIADDSGRVGLGPARRDGKST